MPSYYEINVSLNGRHYFATAPRSLTLYSEAMCAAADFQKRFPAAEGFKVTMTHWECRGQSIEIGE